MSNLISPCCGAEYTDNEDGPSYCCDAKISESGICYECKEHTEPEIGFVCNGCKEFFHDSIEDYEYMEQMKDSIAEDNMDEEKLGL
jgi:hypothetical protein